METVELLLAHGANPNVTDDWKGQTALMWAVAEDHVAIIDTLVVHGADVNVTATGLTPLLLAVQLGQEASMHTLLAAGADVTVTSPAKQPLTHVAAATDHHQLGPTLFEHGVDPNARNARGRTTLHAVLEARRLKHQSRRTTPSLESYAFLEQLIAHGAEIDARVVTPPKPETAKPEAADDDETDPDAKDKPDPADNYSFIDARTDLAEATPLLFAARSGDVEALRLLLEHGADPLAVTKGGNTALTLAAGVVFHEGGQGQGEGPPKADALEAVQLLMELGCGVNAKNENGQTACARRRLSRGKQRDPVFGCERRADGRGGCERTNAAGAHRGGAQPGRQPDPSRRGRRPAPRARRARSGAAPGHSVTASPPHPHEETTRPCDSGRSIPVEPRIHWSSRMSMPTPLPKSWAPVTCGSQVRAASLNFRDLLLLGGTYPGADEPVVPLSDGAGEVLAVGPGVTRVAVGDRVTATTVSNWIDGAIDRSSRAGHLGLLRPGLACRRKSSCRTPPSSRCPTQ